MIHPLPIITTDPEDGRDFDTETDPGYDIDFDGTIDPEVSPYCVDLMY